MKIQIKVLNKEFYQYEKWGKVYYDLPQYQTFGSCAVDLDCTEDVVIRPQERVKIPTGLAIWIGGGTQGVGKTVENTAIAGLILPRSGLGTKGLVLANTVGLIDTDYQGELIISAWNSLTADQSRESVVNNTIAIKKGNRIAQLMFVPVIKAEFELVDDFKGKTLRGDGGFGHSGR